MTIRLDGCVTPPGWSPIRLCERSDVLLDDLSWWQRQTMYFVMFLLLCGIIATTSHKNLTYSEKSIVKSFFFLRKRKRLATEHMLWKLQMPEHADYCPVNAGNITCWADSARQKCIGLNMTTESIYSKIKAAAPDLKKMHEMYHRCAGAAVAKSKCRKGHKHIKNYEKVRHQCRHLLGARPR